MGIGCVLRRGREVRRVLVSRFLPQAREAKRRRGGRSGGRGNRVSGEKPRKPHEVLRRPPILTQRPNPRFATRRRGGHNGVTAIEERRINRRFQMTQRRRERTTCFRAPDPRVSIGADRHNSTAIRAKRRGDDALGMFKGLKVPACRALPDDRHKIFTRGHNPAAVGTEPRPEHPVRVHERGPGQPTSRCQPDLRRAFGEFHFGAASCEPGAVGAELHVLEGNWIRQRRKAFPPGGRVPNLDDPGSPRDDLMARRRENRRLDNAWMQHLSGQRESRDDVPGLCRLAVVGHQTPPVPAELDLRELVRDGERRADRLAGVGLEDFQAWG